MKVNKKLNKGFTIIEVMIVLGIAGLIMLVVFLAVPALQRNNRNSAYRQEAARILAGVQEFITNNDGKVPASTDAATIQGFANLKEYSTITIQAHSATNPAPTQTTVIVRTGASCDTTNAGTAKVGTARQVAIYYQIEGTGDTKITQCTQS